MLNILNAVPSDLKELYIRMMKQIDQLTGKDPERCRMIPSTVTLVYRPLHLLQLSLLTGFKGNIAESSTLERLVNKFGSFLTIRNSTIYFVHQSDKDFLTEDPNSRHTIFPSGAEAIHHAIFSRSLKAMTMPEPIRRIICALPHPGVMIDEVNIQGPDHPLATVQYSCVHWIDHLRDCGSSNDLQDGGVVE